MTTVEEQREHRRLWVEALRSGKYKQAKGMLRNGDGFCCLGVACDLYDATKWETIAGEYVYRLEDGNGSSRNYLPSSVVEYFGLANHIGGYSPKSNGISDALGQKNDGGATFKDIAAIIEAEPKGLLA